MPELPEVEALTRFLDEKCAGKTISRIELAALSALKTYDPPIESLRGSTIESVSRRGKYLLFDVPPVWMVIHLARGGWVQWRDSLTPTKAKPGRGPLALRVGLEDHSGFDITEQGTEKRLAVWVARSPSDVEGVARLGPDPLDPSFDAATLGSLLAGQPGNLKNVLTDQSIIAGVGNAYSDEALHAAKMSPYKPAGKLTDAEVATLYGALIRVLRDAVDRSLGLPASGLKSEKKSGLSVHGRAGQPCPVCGDTIREVSFSTKSMQYCPKCQTGGKPLADRRLSRLLK